MRKWGLILGVLAGMWLLPLICLADVYITPQDALREIFPDYQEYKVEAHTTQDGQKVDVFRIFADNQLIGWAASLNEKGMKEPITFLAGIGLEGRILDVYVLEYLEPHGFEIKEKSFLKQFHGKTVESSLTVGEDVDAVTKATISSKAAAAAVKKALIIINDLKNNA